MPYADSIAPAVLGSAVAGLTWLLLLFLLRLVHFIFHLSRIPGGVNTQVPPELKVHIMEAPKTYPVESEVPSLLGLSLHQIGVPTLQPER